MQASRARSFGAAAMFGALLSVATSLPSAWFGAPETDAYLFDPAVFSPLWIERTLVPATSVLAGALVLAGFAGLVARDRRVANRARRWGGSLTLAGLVLLEVTLVAFTVGMGASRGGSELVAVLFILTGTGVGLLAVLLLVPGMVTAGVGYARTDRPTVGYALAGGMGLSGLVTVAIWFLAPATELGFLPSVLPFSAAIGVVGWELWTNPEPVGPPDETDVEDPEVTDASDEATDDTIRATEDSTGITEDSTGITEDSTGITEETNGPAADRTSNSEPRE